MVSNLEKYKNDLSWKKGGINLAFRTKWLGLWQPDNKSEYKRSAVLSVEIFNSIPDTFRIVVKKNKSYKKGTKRPVMQFAFADTDSESVSSMISSKDLCFMVADDEVDDLKDLLTEFEEAKEKVEELEDIIDDLEYQISKLKSENEALRDKLYFTYGDVDN